MYSSKKGRESGGRIGDRNGLPAFVELPALEDGTERHSWTVYGEGDNFGTLNNLTPDCIVAAATEVVTGERVGLQLPPCLPDPPFYGRDPLRHQITQTGRNQWDDRIDSFYPQRSTQWDGFRHVRFRQHGFYGGVTDDPPEMGDRLSVHHWAERGIVGRGVLLDVGAFLSNGGKQPDPMTEYAISADDLQATAEAQGVAIKEGDILCIRTGWVSRYKSLSTDARATLGAPGGRPAFIGLSAAVSTVRRLWDWHVSAVAADNPAVESSPGSPAVGSLHRRALAQLGIPLGELFDFDQLAERSRRDDRWSFMFVSVPLAIAGGVGTPANAVAVR